MLRAGLHHANVSLDFAAIVDPARPTGLPGADELVAFTRALVGRTPELDVARTALVDTVGEAATAATAGAVGNFEMMNRLLDATGVPTPMTMAEITAQLAP